MASLFPAIRARIGQPKALQPNGQSYDPTQVEVDPADYAPIAPDTGYQPSEPPSSGDQGIWPGYDPNAGTGPDTRQAQYDQSVAPQSPSPATYGGGGVAAGAGAVPGANIQDATRAALLKLLQTPQDVDANAIQSNPAMRAYKLSAQRSEERQRAALAERAAYEGWADSGAFDTQVQGLAQQ